MLKIIAAVLLAISLAAAAAESPYTPIDLDNPAALARLKETNPAHYRKIRKILAGLAEQPQRAEGRWLEANFDAHFVSLSRFMLKTSNPPQQELRFMLDMTQYSMSLTRHDLTATLSPAVTTR